MNTAQSRDETLVLNQKIDIMRRDFLELKQHMNEVIQEAIDEIKEVEKDYLAIENGNR
jgi:hypothetical protein